MAKIDANGLTFEYETFGDDTNPPLVLIMGLGAQMIRWPKLFLEALAERGYYVVIFDNRDVGLSSKMDGAPVPNIKDLYRALRNGENPDVPYTLYDMADDTAALIGALNIAPAHVYGASLGGMVAQTFAATHPDKVASLISVMSSPVDPANSPDPTLPHGSRTLSSRSPEGREENIKAYAEMLAANEGSLYKEDSQDQIDLAAECYDRAYYPAGHIRQMAAAAVTGDRRELVKTIKCPTLVLHGDEDPLVPIEHGQCTASLIPDSRLEVIKGWGHSHSKPLTPLLVDFVDGFLKELE